MEIEKMAILKTLPYMFANLNWKDLAQLKGKEKFILLFPMGSTEAHGPHGPLSTDITISMEVCLRSAERLHNMNYEAYILPPLTYAVTGFAREFPGSINISSEAEIPLIAEICISLINQGMDRILIFNSHFDPGHLKCVYDAIERVEVASGVKVSFTDVKKKRYSSRLTEAFQKGETHADRYETSLIMAIDPLLVNEERRKSLPYLPINLIEKIFKEQIDEFKAMGMAECYCGDPAAASAEEGEKILEILTNFIIEDVEKLFSGASEGIQRGLYGR